MPADIGNAIDHIIQHFNRYQERKHTPRHMPPHNRFYVPRRILLNDTFASQSKIGWRNFLKGRISRKWGVLLRTKKMNVIDAFKRSIKSSLWKHALQLWEFRNDESHKDKVRSVAEYKQHVLDDKIREAYQQEDTLLNIMNPLQEKIFEITIDELHIMSYNIRKAWLQSASLYLQRAASRDILARGSENLLLPQFTAGKPPDANN
jgi:hypothetical protein